MVIPTIAGLDGAVLDVVPLAGDVAVHFPESFRHIKTTIGRQRKEAKDFTS